MLPYFVDSKPQICYHFSRSITENRARLGLDGACIRKVLPEYYQCM
jgi:hypothetical protein